MAKEYVFLKIDLSFESKFFVLMLIYGGFPITMSKPFLLLGPYVTTLPADWNNPVLLEEFSDYG